MDGSEHFQGDHNDLLERCSKQDAELQRLKGKCKQQEAELTRMRKNLIFAAQASDGKLEAVEAERDSLKASEESEAALREHFQTQWQDLQLRQVEIQSEKKTLVDQLEVAKSDASLLRAQLYEIQHNRSASKHELKHSGTDKSISSISTRCSEASISSKSSMVGSFWKSSPWRPVEPKSSGRVCCNTQTPWIEETWCGSRSKVDNQHDPVNAWNLPPMATKMQSQIESSETPYLWSQEWWKSGSTQDGNEDVAFCSQSKASAYTLFTAWSRAGGS